MASEAAIKSLKRRHSAALLQTRGVCGVGVEQDESGDFVLAVHLSEDTETVRQAVKAQVGTAPLKLVASGPFRKF